MSETATILLKIPEESSVLYSLADGTAPGDVGLALLSVDIGTMSDAERLRLLEVVGEVAASTLGVSMNFPTGASVHEGRVRLSADSESAEVFQGSLLDALEDVGLSDFVQRPVPRTLLADMGAGDRVPATFSSRALGGPRSIVSSQVSVVAGRFARAFGMSAMPGSGSALMLRGDRIPLTAAAIDAHGARFRIPLLVPEGVETGDGRMFKPLALTTRDLPIPLQWQIKSANGHDGSVLVGRIDSIERVTNGLGNARGVFDTGPYGREAERLVKRKMLRGVSADLDQFEASEGEAEVIDGDGEGELKKKAKRSGQSVITITKGRVMAATLVTRPAFQECRIEIDEEGFDMPPEELHESPTNDRALIACAMISSAIPVVPPAEWFDDPKLRAPSPLEVDDNGRVFGHIALWHVSHVGLPPGTRPPKSQSDYAYFRTGVVRTDTGADVRVGQLTLSGGHADLAMSAYQAVKHYDETKSAVADVAAGEDAYGIWVSGGLRPGVTPEQIRTLRASAPSGDWRPINGRLELVAVCQVNVPGFPVARARVASGYVTALVAAGAAAVAQLRVDPMEERVALLEATELNRRKEALSSRVAVTASEVTEEVLFRDYSPEKREKMASAGEAMPGGRFPIATVQDVKNAIRAVGRVPKSERAPVKKHIIRRAKKLGAMDLIPETWTASVLELSADEQRLRVGAIVASLRFRKKFDENKHLRDTEGKFRDKLARLHADMVDTPGAEAAGKALIEAEKAAEEGRLEDAEVHADSVQKVVDRFKKGAMDRDDSLKAGYAEQGGAMGEILKAMGLDPSEDIPTKYRYSDLPSSITSMISGLLSRLDQHLPEDKSSRDYVPELLTYMSGSDLATIADIQSWLSALTAHLLALRGTDSSGVG
jgi:hypothetical protein